MPHSSVFWEWSVTSIPGSNPDPVPVANLQVPSELSQMLGFVLSAFDPIRIFWMLVISVEHLSGAANSKAYGNWHVIQLSR